MFPSYVLREGCVGDEGDPQRFGAPLLDREELQVVLASEVSSGP